MRPQATLECLLAESPSKLECLLKRIAASGQAAHQPQSCCMQGQEERAASAQSCWADRCRLRGSNWRSEGLRAPGNAGCCRFNPQTTSCKFMLHLRDPQGPSLCTDNDEESFSRVQQLFLAKATALRRTCTALGPPDRRLLASQARVPSVSRESWGASHSFSACILWQIPAISQCRWLSLWNNLSASTAPREPAETPATRHRRLRSSTPAALQEPAD